jgi:hypothetical protein
MAEGTLTKQRKVEHNHHQPPGESNINPFIVCKSKINADEDYE